MSMLPPGHFYFDVLHELGAGGLGRVDKIKITASNAVDKPIGSVWARKRLNEKWAENPTVTARFEREIAALKKMKHANIMTYEGENVPGGERFYVMPCYESSVRHHVAGGTWSGQWREVARCGATLADALAYAHGNGNIHRDLKPDNILFNGGGPLVIADWGLGYFVHKESVVLTQLTRGGMGTEYYCSMEQWASGKCDGRGDIYSLGMTLNEWVTGRQLALALVGVGVNSDTTSETSAGAQKFNALLRNMTELLRDNRPASMTTVAAELRAAANA